MRRCRRNPNHQTPKITNAAQQVELQLELPDALLTASRAALFSPITLCPDPLQPLAFSLMPQISNTPESLLPRSDSRNPATTCRGITSQGRPCRRALASSQAPSPASTPRKKSHGTPDLASLYCWQHKDQAVSSIPSDDPNVGIKPRTSIDTLMDRLGVLEIKDERPRPQKHQERRPRKKTFCCFEIVDEDSGEDDRPPVPLQRPIQRPAQTRPAARVSSTPQNPYQRRPSNGPPQYVRVSSSGQRVSSTSQASSRPSMPAGRKSSASSQTQSFLSWIPQTLSPQTTSSLLTELAKPISDADEEGYIYMFWVTPPTTSTRGTAQAPLPGDIASSLLPPATTSSNNLRPPPQSRSVSDALRAARDLNALTSNPTSNAPGTIRLKIGRTSNVHRRLNEWTRQCSYDLTLIRYYPYTPSSSTSSSPARGPARKQNSSHLVPGRKVPHVHRVERLIHLELTDLRVRDLGRCSECGKEHREWFEVEAAKEALRRVDECVRRWIAWGESI